MPVQINENDEKFLNLPLYGDVKINIFKENKTIKIVIQHINVVSTVGQSGHFQFDFDFDLNEIFFLLAENRI